MKSTQDLSNISLTKQEKRFVKGVVQKKLTMVGVKPAIATARGVKYIIENRIEGDFVECGVWRGGNSLIAAHLFREAKIQKAVYLFDTFAGMSEPGEHDIRLKTGEIAKNRYVEAKNENFVDWCYASLEEVKKYFEDHSIDEDTLRFVKGDLLNTLTVKKNIPSKISMLRLDTDWYESTRLELKILYPLLSQGGILIVDDYAQWAGARKAVDEYFAKFGSAPQFEALSNGGCIGVKP